jgi:GT2 family glycosyltransferase
MASVDVIIPNYNYGRFLPDCVDSVLAQGIDDLRILVIDNASTDDSLDIADALAAGDRRIEIVRHRENRGPHASFNEGIDWARADYMVILCADDLLATGALGSACGALDSCRDAAFALGENLKLLGDGPAAQAVERAAAWRFASGDRFIRETCASLGYSLALGAAVVRTAVQKEVGHYRSSLPYTDDLEMALRLATRGGVVEFQRALGIRREHGGQMSETRFSTELVRLREREAAFDSFFQREGSALPEAGRFQAAARWRLAETAFWSAVSHLRRGRPAAALGLFRYGLALQPGAMTAIPSGCASRLRSALMRSRPSAVS